MIKDLGELAKLLKLLRKQGVTEFKMDAIELKLGDLPSQVQSVDLESASDDEYAGFPPGVLTSEQLMYYSAGGDPMEDPAKDKQ